MKLKNVINKHKSNKIKENSNTVRHLNNGTDHRHSKSCCDQSSPARRTMMPASVRFCSIHLRAISGLVTKLLCILSLKIILLKLLPHLPGANELKGWISTNLCWFQGQIKAVTGMFQNPQQPSQEIEFRYKLCTNTDSSHANLYKRAPKRELPKGYRVLILIMTNVCSIFCIPFWNGKVIALTASSCQRLGTIHYIILINQSLGEHLLYSLHHWCRARIEATLVSGWWLLMTWCLFRARTSATIMMI